VRGVIGHEPLGEELAQLISHYLMRLPEEVAASPGYRCCRNMRIHSLARQMDGPIGYVCV
jgi:hypothetical protein